MHNAIHKVFIPVVVGGMAMPVRAHNGDHGGLFQWLAHMVTSSDHLLALLGLVLVVGVAASWRRVMQRRKRLSLER